MRCRGPPPSRLAGDAPDAGARRTIARAARHGIRAERVEALATQIVTLDGVAFLVRALRAECCVVIDHVGVIAAVARVGGRVFRMIGRILGENRRRQHDGGSEHDESDGLHGGSPGFSRCTQFAVPARPTPRPSAPFRTAADRNAPATPRPRIRPRTWAEEPGPAQPPGRRLVRCYLDSSRERRVAAWRARVTIGCRPSSAIMILSASSVVPPGLVTFWRRVSTASVD